MVLMDRMGRKALQVYGYAIMTFLWVVSCRVCLTFNSVAFQWQCVWTCSRSHRSCPIYALVAFLATLSASPLDPDPCRGFGTLSSSIKALVELQDVSFELLRTTPDSWSIAVSCALNWTATFVVGLGFPIIQNMIGPYVFIIFAGVSLFTMVFLIKFAPETKGKSFSEIEAEFAKLNGIDVDEKKPLDSRQE